MLLLLMLQAMVRGRCAESGQVSASRDWWSISPSLCASQLTAEPRARAGTDRVEMGSLMEHSKSVSAPCLAFASECGRPCTRTRMSAPCGDDAVYALLLLPLTPSLSLTLRQNTPLNLWRRVSRRKTKAERQTTAKSLLLSSESTTRELVNDPSPKPLNAKKQRSQARQKK